MPMKPKPNVDVFRSVPARSNEPDFGLSGSDFRPSRYAPIPIGTLTANNNCHDATTRIPDATVGPSAAPADPVFRNEQALRFDPVPLSPAITMLRLTPSNRRGGQQWNSDRVVPTSHPKLVEGTELWGAH